MPRSRSSDSSARNVRSGLASSLASTQARSLANENGRLPPIAWAAGLPVSRSRFAYLIADEIPTQKCAAASRQLIPERTDETTRSRKSKE